jgi:hypothetical protein
MANVRSLGTVGFGFSALLVVAVSSCGGASGGSDDGGEEGGGSSGTAGASGTAGTPSTGGSAGSSGGTAGTPSGGSAGTPSGGSAGTPSGGSAGMTGGTGSTCMPNQPAQTCSGALPNMHMPADGLLINWSTYVVSSGAWGNSTVGDLTGGTSKYNGRDVMPINVELVGADLHITATIPPYTADVPDDAENYAGLVFWFGPCINASAYGGLEFTVGGSMGGAALKLQVQTSENYPADPANSKGECIFMDCATQWSECKGPDATVTVPAKPELVSMEWAAFAAGSPNTGVDPEGLVGLQFQLECQAMTECVVDMTLGNVSLTAM